MKQGLLPVLGFTAFAAAGPGFNIERTELQVDGEPAVVVDGLPGPDPWRRVFVVHEERLYTLSFQPWVPGGATALDELYTLVIESLHFLPPES